LEGLEGLQLPIWVAHGEGRYDPLDENPKKIKNQQALVFVDDQGKETNEYPMNPNGSPDGLAGITSADGRHLAIMPHPERSIFMWQTPYVTKEIKDLITEANYGTEEHGLYFPWLEIFRNANRWCQKSS
jgi:phosphoribosylformylglycinamidine synthase